MRFLIAAMLVLVACVIAAAESSGGIAVEQAWARASPKGVPNGAAYVTLVNNGSEGDRLVAASSPIAEGIQFHEEKIENGISMMRQLQVVDVPPGGQVKLKPGGIHMMMKLKQQLREGESFPLTLDFEKAGAINVTVKIGKIAAMDDMSGM